MVRRKKESVAADDNVLVTTVEEKDPKISAVEQGLVRLAQSFTQAAKAYAEEHGMVVHVRISMIPELKEKTDGSTK